MRLKSFIVAMAFALGGAAASVGQAQAATISYGSQLDITGIVNVQSSTFAPGGNLDFDQGNPLTFVVISTGDFAPFVSPGATPTLFDLDFTPSEPVWSVGGFTFTANSYAAFDNAFPLRGFEAFGTITGNGFDPTPGMFALTTQGLSGDQLQASFSSSTIAIPLPASVFMLLAALGGLGVLSRHRGAAAA